MRKSRYQKGSIKKQPGRWVAMWWVEHSRKSGVIGLVKDLSKSEARAVVDRIVTEANARRDQNRAWKFGEFVAEVYFPFCKVRYRRTRTSGSGCIAARLTRPRQTNRFARRAAAGNRSMARFLGGNPRRRLGLSIGTHDAVVE